MDERKSDASRQISSAFSALSASSALHSHADSLPPLQPRAAKMRPRTSSTVPLPGMRWHFGACGSPVAAQRA